MARERSIDRLSAIEVIGESIAYADGFEADLLALLERSSDRSTGSLELATEIRDWPSLYHLSKARANILVPLGIGPGVRVLECGAGTGVLTRSLVDQGADVTAVEGALARAECAATRLSGSGPGSARVVCADLGDLSQISDLGTFDLILMIGVLEYFGRYGLDPIKFLTTCRELLRPGGRLALAIENQIGLKYLLGGQEEHVGLPWVGVEGYHEPSGIRTYSRREIARMFDAASFAEVEFLSVFPDYKLPSAILKDALIESDSGPRMMTNFVREPISYRDNAPERLCDTRLATRVFAEAGLGAETSSSILCIASRDEGGASLAPRSDAEGWLFSSCSRRPDLQIARELRSVAGGESGIGFELVSCSPTTPPTRISWFVHEAAEQAPVIAGRCLEDVVLDSLACHDATSALAALRRWYAHLKSLAGESEVMHARNPYCRPGTRAVLPAEFMDVLLGNFIQDDCGELHFVDREWRADGGVELDLVVVRALLMLGIRLVHGGAEHPWPPSVTPDDIAMELAIDLGIEDPFDAVPVVIAADEDLQSLVREGPLFEGGAGEMASLVRLRRRPFDLGWLRLRRDSLRLQEALAGAGQERDELMKTLAETLQTLAETSQTLAETSQTLDHLAVLASNQERNLQEWRARWERLERTWPFRLVRLLRPPAHRR